MKPCEHCGEKIADKRKTCPYCNNEVSKLEIDIIRWFSKSVSVMGLIFNDDGLLFEKKTGKTANGYFCSYYKTFFGLLKSTRPVEAVHVIDGELVEMNEFNLYGEKRILYSTDWSIPKNHKEEYLSKNTELLKKSQKPTNVEEMSELDGVLYSKDTDRPFNGPAIMKFYENKLEGVLKDGKPDGEWNVYYPSGRKYYQRNYKDGELINSIKWDQEGKIIEND
mgnify:CR=1 FL=1